MVKKYIPSEKEKYMCEKHKKFFKQSLITWKNEIIESNRYFDFYMHRVGHYMGLDVHDVGGKDMNGEWLNYAPGMITTIEPGIYINENLDVPEKYKNIGIRIEDNVVVTETGFKVLTDLVPKEVNDIESLMNS